VADIYLGLGSNVGDRESHLAHALARLREEASLTGISSVYETDPVGVTDQPRFLNLVVRIASEREPEDLLRLVRAMEAERDRVRTFRNAPRTLDIDVLLFGDRQIRQDGLIVPHPRMNDRGFVLVPLLELDPELLEPGTGRRYADILAMAGDAAGAGITRTVPGEALLGAAGADAPRGDHDGLPEEDHG
jgi:2-amino-4-hydroxy-6-hydroxymethyldihydropteridine diphosphokinase